MLCIAILGSVLRHCEASYLPLMYDIIPTPFVLRVTHVFKTRIGSDLHFR